jgi:hypothetical protein
MIAAYVERLDFSWTAEQQIATLPTGARNTCQQRSRPESAVFLCPDFVGSPAEYKSLTANRWGRTVDLFLAPGTHEGERGADASNARGSITVALGFGDEP